MESNKKTTPRAEERIFQMVFRHLTLRQRHHVEGVLRQSACILDIAVPQRCWVGQCCALSSPYSMLLHEDNPVDRTVAPTCPINVGRVGDTGNSSDGYQFGTVVVCVVWVTRKERTALLNNSIVPLYDCQDLGKPLDGNVGECQIPTSTFRYNSSIRYYGLVGVACVKLLWSLERGGESAVKLYPWI